MNKVIKKQRGLGTCDQSLFRLWNSESVSDLWHGIVSRKSHVSELKNWMPKHSKKKKKMLRHPISKGVFVKTKGQKQPSNEQPFKE